MGLLISSGVSLLSCAWCLCLCVGGVVSLGQDYFSWDRKLNSCEPIPAGRVEWILYVRNSDYGWGEHTHRANIALDVNAYKGDNEEMRKMNLQLEVEIMKALFSNEIHENDLALYIHALIASCKNPRDFHGTDLVGELLHRVDTKINNLERVHPFLVLALCNSGVVNLRHLESIRGYTEHDHRNFDVDGRNSELKALALKTYACAASLSHNLNKFQLQVKTAAECLTRRQNDIGDGTFGNVYTTSLAVQALTACKKTLHTPECTGWNESGARDYLLREAFSNVNMIKAYYIEMGLNSGNVTYLKDICNKIWEPPGKGPSEKGYYLQYTIKEGLAPDHYFTLTLKVPNGSNFFDIMNHAARLSDRFSFNHTMNHENLPMVYRVSGIPNDAEENMFWRICRQYNVTHDRHGSKITSIRQSPKLLIPNKDDHILLWYRNTDCPQQ